MDNCRHVIKLKPASNHSVLNPQKWHCMLCSTTESVWACLSCPYVACGRYLEEHALTHYKETKHPLAIEVNEKYIFCYECDEYVLNDNPAGDIKILRNCLRAITTQQFSHIRGRTQRLLRSSSYHSGFRSYEKMQEEDKCYTALWFRRYYILAKAFTGWRSQTKSQQAKPETGQDDQKPSTSRGKKSSKPGARTPSSPNSSITLRKRPLTPGVTGLRNLGNTCYMNSILQVLRHVQVFRLFFLRMSEVQESATISKGRDVDKLPSPAGPRKFASLKHLNSDKRSGSGRPGRRLSTGGLSAGGLNGGGSSSSKHVAKVGKKTDADQDKISLCHELHALLRVMWSGKWALVSPHKMLYAVWNIIPFFKGYSQQDAQEFLCEFLDRVQTELDRMAVNNPKEKTKNKDSALTMTGKNGQELVGKMFQGELVSEVTCMSCKHKSKTYEPFMDLSLEFPDRYHHNQDQPSKVCTDPCHITEMLSKFTEVERLEGKIYACEQCNSRRRKASQRPTMYTEVEKRFMVHKLPHVFRLHLKRFMWGGRNHRGKITVPVKFDQEIDLQHFCHEDLVMPEAEYHFKLSAVVMHHGRGFGSGHYTAYCWNEEANSWVHCNDAKMELCNLDDVSRAQAYILVFTRKGLCMSNTELLSTTLREEKDSAIPKFESLKRKLSEHSKGRMQLKRRKSNMW